MTRYIGQEEHHLALAHFEVVGEVAAQIERGQNTVAEPVVAGLERMCREHGLLHLPSRRLILLQNTQ